MAGFDPGAWALERLDGARVTKGGREIQADCPWCRKPGHMYVNADTGAFVCFRCRDEYPSKAPVIYPLIAEVEGISRHEAVSFVFRQSQKFRRLRSRSELPEELEDAAVRILGRVDEELVDVPLPRGTESRIPRYITDRGFKIETARFFGARFHARLVGGPRVVLPIESPGGRSYTARAISKRLDPRYFNPRDSGHAQLLYGWQTVKRGADLVCVEGPFDVWGVHEHGMPVIGLMGKVIHDAQVAQIAAVRPKNLVVMLDPEEEVAALEVASRVRVACERVLIARLVPGEGSGADKLDPGSSTSREFWAAIMAAEPFAGDMAGELEAMAKAIL
jgi:hypothetical protein